jgi:pyroglutamyl-peptidase
MRTPFWPRFVAACALLLQACSSSDESPAPAQQQAQQPYPDTAAVSWEVPGDEGRIDFDYSFELAQHDPSGVARTWTLVDGELPAGLELSPQGAVKGKPTAPGVRIAVVHGQGPCGDLSCRVQVRLSIPIAEVILLAGFGPFAGMPVNPSWQAIEPLKEAMIGGYDVRVMEIPVVWDEAFPLFFAEYFRLRPSMAIGTGVAMGNSTIRLEKTARNHAAGVDEANDEWTSGEIEPGGPATYTALLPLNMLQASLKGAQFGAVITSNAGDYLCNFLFYGLMKQMVVENPERHILGGFVHVPKPEAIAPAQMTEAWKLMLGRLAEYRRDLLATHGAAHDTPAIPTLDEPPSY